MNGRSYIIDFYDSRHYTGPTPVRAHGVNLLQGPNGVILFLLNLERELLSGDTPFQQILVTTSYDGDPIEMVTNSACTVTIHIVSSESPLDENSEVMPGMSQFLCNGKISPSSK